MVGENLGVWVVQRLLWTGGASQIYRAMHPLIGRPVALKVLLRDHLGSPELVEAIFNEAKSLNSCPHPGLVEVYDLSVHRDGRPYIVMELLEGETLRDLHAREGVIADLRASLSIAAQVAEAAGALHEGGIVHRNLTPRHVFVLADADGGGPRVKLIDLGQALMGGRRRRRLRTAGTPGYMAPEQERAPDAVDRRADVYSLGRVLEEMIRPREGTPLHDLIARMLRPDRAERPGSMSEVAAALRRLADPG